MVPVAIDYVVGVLDAFCHLKGHPPVICTVVSRRVCIYTVPTEHWEVLCQLGSVVHAVQYVHRHRSTSLC